MRKTLLAAAATFLVFSTAAFAQVEQPSQISIQGTALITKDTTSDSTSTLNRATKSGGFLLGYSYQFNHWAGVEGNYGYTRNTQNYFGTFGQSAVEANTHDVTGSFVFHIPVKVANVRPYALAGGGASGCGGSEVGGQSRPARPCGAARAEASAQVLPSDDATAE